MAYEIRTPRKGEPIICSDGHLIAISKRDIAKGDVTDPGDFVFYQRFTGFSFCEICGADYMPGGLAYVAIPDEEA